MRCVVAIPALTRRATRMPVTTALAKHFAALSACERCPRMLKPVVVGRPVMSKVILVGQAPGERQVERIGLTR